MPHSIPITNNPDALLDPQLLTDHGRNLYFLEGGGSVDSITEWALGVDSMSPRRSLLSIDGGSTHG
jgi:hypothetical protein